jgi:hypothetical protein
MDSTLTLYRTQPEVIRDHLKAGKSITPAHALLVYGISRLAPAIEVLRRKGLAIVTIMRQDERGHKYAEYRIPNKIKIGSMVTVKQGHGYGLPTWIRRSRPARVVGLLDDVAYVEFQHRDRIVTEMLNVKELNNVTA